MKTGKNTITGMGVAAALALTGCVSGPYVPPESFNPVSPDAYTRAETIPAGQRLVNQMLANAVFAQRYQEKVQQRGGVPVLQVANFENISFERNGKALAVLHKDIEDALLASGRFLLSEDPDACDYILQGDLRDVSDGARVTHRVSLRLVDVAADLAVWTGSDEIAKGK